MNNFSGQVAANFKDLMTVTCKDVSLLLEAAKEMNSLLSALDLKSLDLNLDKLPIFTSCDDGIKQAFRFATSLVRSCSLSPPFL